MSRGKEQLPAIDRVVINSIRPGSREESQGEDWLLGINGHAGPKLIDVR